MFDGDPVIRSLTMQLEQKAAEIERLQAEVVQWKREAGKYSAGCELCAPREAENERLRAALAQIHGFASVMDESNWRDLRLHIERQCSARGAFEPAEIERLVPAFAALLNEFSKSNDYRPDSMVVRNAWAALRSGHEQGAAKEEPHDSI